MIVIEWRKKTGQYATGYDAYVGAIRVGCTERSLSRALGEWHAIFYLPGVSIEQGVSYQSTDADARTVVEMATKRWFNKAGITTV